MKIIKGLSLLALPFFILACDGKNEEVNLNFKGVGHEPAWGLVIVGKDANILYNYGTDKVSFVLEKNETKKKDSFIFKDEATKTTINIEKKECQDTMADNIFQYTVNIELKDKKLSGCGNMI